MRIEMNCENTEGNVPEEDRNNRVIIERFKIAYYRFPYEKIPIIMIRHLAMNSTRNLNLFPSKV